jgi:cytochrome P450
MMTASTIASPPVADWFTVAELHQDPFPIYARLREESPVAWVPAMNRYVVTSFEECLRIEHEAETFSANEEGSLMKRSMGHSMLRKDDPEHAIQRASYGSTLRPKTVMNVWQAIFAANGAKFLADVMAAGPGVDLIKTFAGPFAAENLRAVMGFNNVTQQDMQRWSQTMIDGTGNYADDPTIWRLSAESSAQVDVAIEEMLPYYRTNPNDSILSGLANMEDPLPIEDIRANMKMTIGGGLNEPRDVLGIAMWALLDHPDQMAQVVADPSLSATAFDEAIRWVAPIGFYPRQTTREVELGGVLVPANAHMGIAIGSGNRDETRFENAHEYNMNRERKSHLAFGGGVHFCAGAWVARSQVANIAIPLLLKSLPGLTLMPGYEPQMRGWVFPGMVDLKVTWNA